MIKSEIPLTIIHIIPEAHRLIISDQNKTESPLINPLTNEIVLFARQTHYDSIWQTYQNDVTRLKREYGCWAEIPNQIRTFLANYLRNSGFTYEPENGWFPPNSNNLSY
ncbi:hypothetical protein A3D05_06040 [Candidatus Gottesmanbacteria bacterium RIFCSPHIGHO2_02_FULL_40_24]|uniref:Uncharacterized protein n=1 Tax=Candidatus Gottesmanbacteria bacterium RIFCSPHIGHO2_01_FULL_40_15 TaxID=1798376 RepID=A0A1F5Z7E9_9BACT|nr:MAG: hypothetical protein A2777_02960 [Candidatus Gottesmanbacteria bacterium RIFCSPHIGHO2_01_FULL_40_15]OGG16797.1 MAG: hypothetical protein A3D05_06040 [Candidatus Gottesmanbacteria bacterium RIFCSPHIGHO2_02_FULL_40_24]OGG23118.1 MAG: hypothetical protein A3E42_04135 [Candidatus Gottesmanbacteria bacterium RIFCSPHIGHO2_12_FULL_40_13]